MRPVFQARVYRGLFTLALGATALLSLQACVPLMLGGTVAGAIVATDRRTLGAQTDDAAIELKATGRATKITGEKGRVAVSSFNRMVLLTGEVADEKMKAEVQKQIETIAGIKSIENDLVIAPVSSVGVRSNDALITGRVKAAIIDTQDLYVNAFKVHTDRSVVYLMGRVTEREAKLGGEVARNAASKINKVVLLFEYIDEDEAKKFIPKQADDKEKPAAADPKAAPAPAANPDPNVPPKADANAPAKPAAPKEAPEK
jgi:osmotically-inducible protein OsmY